MTRILINLFVKNKEAVENMAIRNRYALLSNVTGIIVNIALCITKLLVGVSAGSVAVIADAFNNLSDAGCNIVTFLGFRLSSKHADKKHPLGHGRMEYLTALIVNIMIIVVGFELLGSSIDKIKNPSPTNISSIFIILVALSIAVKLWLYFFYRTIGTTIDSTAIKATALDSLTDVLATSLVLVSSIISKHFTIQLDGWAGILMSGFILFAGVRALRKPVELLLGSAPDPDYLTKIELFVKQYPGVLGIHNLIVHDYGPTRFIITLHAEISAEISLITAHEIIDQIEKDMQKHFHCQVTIHPDPITVNSK